MVRCDGVCTSQKTYRGKDASGDFIKSLLKEKADINLVFANPLPLSEPIKDSNTCWICEKPIYPNYHCKCSKPKKPTTKKQLEDYSYKNDKGFVEYKCLACNKKINKFRKVVDHCHVTGKFRGIAQDYCNLKLRVVAGQTPIPVVFHNLENYDAHLIMQGLKETQHAGTPSCIAKNSEKYISFSLGQLRFIDSFNFMASSLDKLVKACPKTSFDLLRSKFGNEHIDSLLQKGIYPYEYMDSFYKFKETCLPPIEEFYSSLKQSGITQEEYERAQRVWETFDLKTMGDYHDLYVTTDTLLLAGVFENFTRVCKQNYGLDPANYYTAPGLSWDALLKHTGIELELLTNVDKHLFFERAKRGGISSVGHQRYFKANNKYLPDYDPQQPSSYIMYLDANNLYGWAMSQPLPYAGFKWLNPTQLKQFTPNTFQN